MQLGEPTDMLLRKDKPYVFLVVEKLVSTTQARFDTDHAVSMQNDLAFDHYYWVVNHHNGELFEGNFHNAPSYL
jgi:hypothetical protein